MQTNQADAVPPQPLLVGIEPNPGPPKIDAAAAAERAKARRVAAAALNQDLRMWANAKSANDEERLNEAANVQLEAAPRQSSSPQHKKQHRSGSVHSGDEDDEEEKQKEAGEDEEKAQTESTTSVHCQHCMLTHTQCLPDECAH